MKHKDAPTINKGHKLHTMFCERFGHDTLTFAQYADKFGSNWPDTKPEGIVSKGKNLASLSKAQLLALITGDGSEPEPVEKPKRGRPKGSTNKPKAVENNALDFTTYRYKPTGDVFSIVNTDSKTGKYVGVTNVTKGTGKVRGWSVASLLSYRADGKIVPIS